MSNLFGKVLKITGSFSGLNRHFFRKTKEQVKIKKIFEF